MGLNDNMPHFQCTELYLVVLNSAHRGAYRQSNLAMQVNRNNSMSFSASKVSSDVGLRTVALMGLPSWDPQQLHDVSFILDHPLLIPARWPPRLTRPIQRRSIFWNNTGLLTFSAHQPAYHSHICLKTPSSIASYAARTMQHAADNT